MDYIIRASAADGQIRAFAATTRELAEQARKYHNTSPVASAALGRTLTAAAMMGIMMKGQKDVMTIQIRGDGPIGGITVTTDSAGGVKGYVNNPGVMLPANAKGKLDVGGAVGKGTLTVIRDLGLKDPYVGQVDLQTGEIADDLTYYFALSEQVPSSVGLGVLMEKDNTVKQAGGFIVQLMPGTEDDVIDQLEKNLQKIPAVTKILDAGKRPEELLDILLEGLAPEILDKVPTQYKCNCSRDRMAKALISIGEKELRSMIDDGEPVELKCHFCGTGHTFSIDELKAMLEAARG